MYSKCSTTHTHIHIHTHNNMKEKSATTQQKFFRKWANEEKPKNYDDFSKEKLT